MILISKSVILPCVVAGGWKAAHRWSVALHLCGDVQNSQ